MRQDMAKKAPKWPLAVGLFVAIGIALTIGYTFVENFWG
jgi:hypothetical protein